MKLAVKVEIKIRVSCTHDTLFFSKGHLFGFKVFTCFVIYSFLTFCLKLRFCENSTVYCILSMNLQHLCDHNVLSNINRGFSN